MARIDGKRIDVFTVLFDAEMEVWSCRYACISELPHDLPLFDSHAFFDSCSEPVQVGIERCIAVRMFDHEEIAVSAFPIGKRNDAVGKCHNRRSRLAGPIDAIMRSYAF